MMLVPILLTMMVTTPDASPSTGCPKSLPPGKPSAACSFDWFLLNQFNMTFEAFAASTEALRRAAVAEYAAELLSPSTLNPHGRLPKPVKAWTMRIYVSRINARCHVLGVDPPACSKTNPMLARAFPEVTCHLVVSDPDGGGTAVLLSNTRAYLQSPFRGT